LLYHRRTIANANRHNDPAANCSDDARLRIVTSWWLYLLHWVFADIIQY
jgi:hypothetical protein